MKYFFIVLLLGCFVHSPAQIKLEWEQTDSSSNIYFSFIVDDNGNCYLGGDKNFTESYLLIKYNSAGGREWVAQYADTFGGWITDMAIDKFSNIYVTGNSAWKVTLVDIATIKYNSSGTEQWIEKYDTSTTVGTDEIGESIAVDSLGNVYVLATKNYNGSFDTLILIKYDSSGQEEWVKSYGKYDIPFEDGKQVKLFNEQYLYIGASRKSPGNGFVLKYDLNGNLLWESQLGNGSYQGITVDKKGNAYLSEDDSGNISITKFDSLGIKQWSEETSYSGNNTAKINHLILDGNEDIIIAGRSQFYDGVNLSDSLLMMKYSSDGMLLWKKIFSSDLWDEGFEAATDNDNNIYVIAQFDTSNRIFKLDKDGNELWSFPVKGDKIRLDSQNNIYVAGTVDNDFYVAKYSQITSINEKKENGNLAVSIYPNPFGSSAVVLITSPAGRDEFANKELQFTIYNLLGEEVRQFPIRNSPFVIYRENIPAGIYFYQVTSDQKPVARGKLVIVD